MVRFSRLLFLLLIFSALQFALRGFAQTSNGTIAGSVTDSSGAAITNATVTAVSLQTSQTRVTQTSGTGAYRMDEVLPGDYTVTAEATGFAKTQSTVHVSASVVTSVNAELRPGSDTQTIQVDASTQTLETDTGYLSGTIDAKQVQNLPVNNLNAYTLALTLPGVTTVTAADFANGPSFSVNGTRPRGNNFLIEGQDNNDWGLHGQGLQPANLEAVEEVSVLTNSYQAEFGNGGSSVSNLIFKSGSNVFHGAAWNRLLNSSLDANDKQNNFNGVPKPKYRENIFGFLGSGPIIKDKLFAMGSFQWDRYRSSSPGDVLILPTPEGLAKLQTYASNPQVATLLQAIGNPSSYAARVANNDGVQLLGPDPTTGVDRGSVATAGYQRSLPNDSNSTELDLKGDYTVSQQDSLGLRLIRSYSIFPFDPNFPGELPGFDAQQDGVSYNAGVTETHVFSPNVLNELRLSYGRIGFNFDLQPATYANALLSPSVTINGLIDQPNNGGGWGAPSGDPQGRFHNTYQAQDSISWRTGNHFFKFGADVADIRVDDRVPFDYYGSVNYQVAKSAVYSGLANYIDNFGGNNGSIGKDFGSPVVVPQLIFQSYFAQDTWKVRPNFSVDLGVRYEYSGAPFNAVAYPAINMSNPTCFPCRVTQQADGADWGPRVGFAYSPRNFGGGTTVLRGAFGVFYDHLFSNIIDNIQASTPNAQAGNIVSQATNANPRGTPNWSAQLGTLQPAAPSPFDFQESITSHLLSPEILQWNLNIEQQLPGAFTMQIGYVGTRGEHLFATTEFNPYQPSGLRYFPDRGRMIREDNTGDSIYHGADVQVKRNFNRGLTLQAAYTFSKFLDDTSEVFTDGTGNWSTYAVRQYPFPRKSTEFGPSAYDHRQRFSIAYVYAIPKWNVQGPAEKVAGAIVNNWQVSGITALQSGGVGNVEVGTDVNLDGISNDRPELGAKSAPLNTYAFDGNGWGIPDANGNVVAPGTYCEGKEYWYTNDPCNPVSRSTVHWIVPAYGTTGGPVERNTVPLRGTTQWNMSVQRTFPIHESHSVDFRAEMFNIFNHGDVGTPSYTLGPGLPFTPADGPTTFNNFSRTVNGNRSFRMLLRYSF
jgi:hypothetical protein